MGAKRIELSSTETRELSLITVYSSLKVEHREEIILLQHTLMFSAFFISFQVVLCFFVLSATDLLQLLFGLQVLFFLGGILIKGLSHDSCG